MIDNKDICIVEVAPRDGIEGLNREISVDFRVELISQLLDAGLQCIEVGGFVSPKAIPALKDTAQVIEKILKKFPAGRFIALVPNLHGLVDAIHSGIREITIFTAASDTFTHANINCSIEESFQRFIPMMQEAEINQLKVRGVISTIISCPFEGPIAPQKVATLAKRLWDLGCYEIVLGDTNGFGTPEKVQRVIQYCMDQGIPVQKISVHFHNTYGQALANIYAALQMGVVIVESAVGGLGGCPNAPGATGNVATEDLVYLLAGLNKKTGINLEKLVAVGQFACASLQMPVESKVNLAMQALRQ